MAKDPTDKSTYEMFEDFEIKFVPDWELKMDDKEVTFSLDTGTSKLKTSVLFNYGPAEEKE